MKDRKIPFTIAGKKVFVAGHRGMVGSAVLRRLANENVSIQTVCREKVDLRDKAKVVDFFNEHRPQVVVIAAAKVGGILANDRYPAEFLHDNLEITSNVIAASHNFAVEKLLFLGSSCIYPKLATQPIPETSLMTGSLEPTNEWYAVAKIAGLKLCEAYRKQYGCDFISAMPTNLYGTGDNYDRETSHVMPALIRKFVEAKCNGAASVEMWGTGRPLREFMHADDLADALVHLLKNYSAAEPINVGTGHELSIYDLALKIKHAVAFDGTIVLDPRKPDGTPRKRLDCARLEALGWSPKISLDEGIAKTISEFRTRYCQDAN